MTSLSTVHRATRFALLFCLALPPLARAATTTPAITATPAVLAFSYQVGAATLPAAQTVAFKSNVTGLTGSLSVAGDAITNGGWLATSIRTGISFNLPASISITATPTGLNPGSYPATITITAATSSGTITQTVSVTLTITSVSSALHVTPATLPTFFYTTGGTVPASQFFTLYSDGSPMSATIAVSSATWLTLNPTGTVQVGGLLGKITASINPTVVVALAPKTYTANVTITAPTATVKSITYAITLTVSAAPPVVTSTWPSGVVISSAGTGTSAIVVNGSSFFSTSTVTVAGFTNSTKVSVTDTSATPIVAAETISIPVYSATAAGLRLTLGSPLPTGYAATPYLVDLSAYVAGGTGPYVWTASSLPAAFTLSTAGLLTSINPATGTYNLVLTVTDAVGAQAYMPLSLTVYAGAVPPASSAWLVVNGVIPAATVGVAYSASVAVVGGSGTYTWSTDATTPLPAGLSLTGAGAGATVGGTPTSVGSVGALTAKLLSDGALQVTVPNTYLTKLGFLRMAVTTPAPGGGTSNETQLQVYGPEPRILAVCNSASYASGTIAPGELITVFGTGLGPSALAVYDPNAATLPTSLPTAGTVTTQVSFLVGGLSYPAALIYTSGGQVGVMVPFQVAGSAAATLTVTYGLLTSASYPLSVASFVPGIYTLDGSGMGQGAILNYNATTADYTVNGSANAALKGSIVVLYITGFGVTLPASSSWSWAPAGVDSAAPVSVNINGEAATVVSAVPVNSFPGVLQVNVTLPADATTGKAVPLTVSVGGISAQTGVTLAVK